MVKRASDLPSMNMLIICATRILSYIDVCQLLPTLYFIPSAIHNTGPGSGGHVVYMEARNLYGDEPAEDCMATPL